MPRKSKALRTQQTKDLIAAYEAAGLSDNRNCRFAKDMYWRLSNNKGLSTKRRAWLDSIIEEGVPKPKDPSALYKKLEEARNIFIKDQDKAWEINVLGDFMYRESKGWQLSIKQVALVDKLVNKAKMIDSGENHLEVTSRMKEELEAAAALWSGYTTQWKLERPALAKARERVVNYLAGNVEYIEEYHYVKLTKGVSSRLKKLFNPRFSEGDVGYYTRNREKTMALCIKNAYISDTGSILNDWIISGSVETIGQDCVAKR